MFRALIQRLQGLVGPTQRHAVMEECEPRILYSADLNPALWATTHETSAQVAMVDPPAAAAPAQQQTPAEQERQEQRRSREIVFVDDKVEDSQTLIDAIMAARGAQTDIEIVSINSSQDGLQQITDVLAGERDLSAIHVISHGSSGQLLLGNSSVNSGTLDTQSDNLNRWRAALTSDADLLLYGCDVASGEMGQAFIEQLAQATGADVAASLDATGNSNQGGDWALESSVGNVEAVNLLDQSNPIQWQGLLATYTVINTSDTGAGSLRQAITDANANAGTDNISFNIAGTGVHTITLTSTLPHITDTVMIDGQQTDVVSPDGTPIGPGLHGRYLLGADQNGRDVMVRLMYGGRTSIYIGVAAAAITTVLAVLVGLLCGYYRGWVDATLSRIMDVVWAFPVLLLGIALGTALALGGLKIGALQIAGDSLWIPIMIIGLVYVPYMARPIRGEILALREKEFMEAAVAQGKGPVRIMVSELLPNVVSTIIVFFTLNIANNMLLESALSFLGAGVRAPNASWGTMIADGYQTIYTAPHLTIVPGLMIVLTVLSLNVFGDGLRDALDPRAKIRLEH